MFSYIKGKLAEIEASAVIIDCGGVGYYITTTAHSIGKVPSIGEDVKFYTYLAVREDAMELYGFAEKAELDCFKLMTSVSGVGNKVAISILSEFSPSQFFAAIARDDSKTLTSASGVGPKLASRIVLELQDKIGKLPMSVSSGDIAPSGGFSAEACKALMVLGYSASDAKEAVKINEKNAKSVEELIKLSLKSLI